MLSFYMFSSRQTSLPAPRPSPSYGITPRPITPFATPLESALMQVLIPRNLKSLEMSVYEKIGGCARIWLTRHATKRVCPERPSASSTHTPFNASSASNPGVS